MNWLAWHLIPDSAVFLGGSHGRAATLNPPGGNPYCENCGGQSCMDCVFRVMHDACEDDCPLCW